jgi:hypothetical protein
MPPPFTLKKDTPPMKTLDYIHKVEAHKGTPKPADPSIDTERLDRVTLAKLHKLNTKMPVTVKQLYEGA